MSGALFRERSSTALEELPRQDAMSECPKAAHCKTNVVATSLILLSRAHSVCSDYFPQHHDSVA